ncbi:DUF3953 domain-containing protein [Thalassobacillus sp. B23F22_16]
MPSSRALYVSIGLVEINKGRKAYGYLSIAVSGFSLIVILQAFIF